MRPSPRALLAHAGVDALLVTDLVNIRYLTGCDLSAGFVLVTPRAFLLLTDARYLEGAQQTAKANVAVRDQADMTKAMSRIPACGFEEDVVTVARYRGWRRSFAGTKFLRTSGAVESFRRQKDEEELRAIRRAHRMTEELLRRVPSALRKGTTERGLAWKLRVWAQELGADGLAFSPIVAFGSHTSRPHHLPTSRALQKGHMVQIDVGAVYGGYCADRSQVFFTTEPTPQQEKAYRAVREAKDAVIAACVPGASTRALDQLARSVLKKDGMDAAFCHALGHGVGLEVHEGVTLSSRQPDSKLLAREVVAVEPGVYFPGKFGIRLEDMVMVS